MRYRAEDFQKDFWVNIGKRIRLRREQFGLTRDQLSYTLDIIEAYRSENFLIRFLRSL